MAPGERIILHVDMDAFFASVEQRDDPTLRGKPVLVGGDGPRGVVAAASYEARVFGCHSAQPMSIAKRRCPDAIIVKGRFDAYREASGQVFEILESISPLVQPLSIDEAFVDVSDPRRSFSYGSIVAAEIRAQVLETTGLTASVGAAPNKFLAKIASDNDKPDGLTVIKPDRVQEALDPLPVSSIFGIGPATEEKLRRVGVRRIADVRTYGEARLRERFGSHGERLWELAHGRDDRPVTPERQAKSIGREQTFGADLEDPQHVRRVLLWHTEQVARRLRKHGLRSRGVHIKIRYGDFETITRAATLEAPTDRTDLLWDAASGLFDQWAARAFRPVRLIGMTANRFDDEPQMSLFGDGDDEKRRSAERVVDEIVARFGKQAIRRAGSIDTE